MLVPMKTSLCGGAHNHPPSVVGSGKLNGGYVSVALRLIDRQDVTLRLWSVHTQHSVAVSTALFSGVGVKDICTC